MTKFILLDVDQINQHSFISYINDNNQTNVITRARFLKHNK
jgi:hypothetical protein